MARRLWQYRIPRVSLDEIARRKDNAKIFARNVKLLNEHETTKLWDYGVQARSSERRFACMNRS